MLAFYAFLPMVVVIVLMLFFKRPAKEALPLGWCVAVLVAIGVWHQQWQVTGAWALEGFLEAVSVLAIIIGAVMVMNTLKESGAMASIEKGFCNVNPDRRIQAILIGFVFSAFLEGAAGFGTPAAITGPLMVGLGFPPLCAAIISLLFNTVPVSFGAVGTPTNTAIAIVAQSVRESGGDVAAFGNAVSLWSAIGHAASCFFIVAYTLAFMCKFFGPNKSWKDVLPVLPFAMFTSLVFDVFYIAIAYFAGAEFPALGGALLTLLITLIAAKKGFLCPKTPWAFTAAGPAAPASTPVPENADKPRTMSLFKAWLPYILIGVFLVCTRINICGIKPCLQSADCCACLNHICGVDGVNWKWNWGWNPGLFPFILVCVITFFLHRMNLRQAKAVMKITFKQCAGAALALFFGVSMVYIFRNTGMAATESRSMLYVMAETVGGIFRSSYIVVAPFIGVLGAFMSGSNTVSNTLFTGLQYQTAVLVGLSPVMAVVLQNIGGAAGNMVCINNVVAACATTGTIGEEGKIIKYNILPCLLYGIIVIAVAWLAVYWSLTPENALPAPR